ncbi:replication protein RepA [Sphingomonas sp. 3-13AW]|uniref:replication protein RepA n=1 Tax=Sphingomonas sp. 3-13AW TaxID=3050450 RepID=UPI003BB80CEE
MAGTVGAWSDPDGKQYALQLASEDAGEVRRRAEAHGHGELFDVAFHKHGTKPAPAFLHSVLCAMSLPARRPKGGNEFKPIIRQDRNYSLAITPKPRLKRGADGNVELVNLGVPYGSYPRIILITVLTQAVLQKSRDVYLGGSVRDMMRRFGFETASRGVRGQTDMFIEQLDRLLACEWMIQWDDRSVETAESAFKVNEVKLSHEYAGMNNPDGSFNRELRISEAFYEHLQSHAVRFDMNAIHAIRRKPTAIDLYTYLVFRLPRIPEGKPVELTYEQLAEHMGNDISNPAKIKQTIRKNLDLVSGVYPEARVEMSKDKVRLHNSKRPVPDIKIVQSAGIPPLIGSGVPKAEKAPMLAAVEDVDLVFPSGSLRFSVAAEPFLLIAKKHGNNYDVDNIAESYRNFMKSKGEMPTGSRLLRSFEGFCRSYKPSLL